MPLYAATDDPYCYKGTSLLKNKAGLKDEQSLERYEIAATTQRSEESLPSGKFGSGHFKAIHRHLFQDVYTWAGKVRTVRISKGGNEFCYPENIDRELDKLFLRLKNDNFLKGISKEEFASKATSFLADLNSIHPFREGNGRAQHSFLWMLAMQAGHPLQMEKFDKDNFRNSVITSFSGEEGPLENVILNLVS